MDDAFLAQLFADRQPLVCASEQLVPIFPGFFSGNEFLAWSDVEYHTIIEVRIKMEIGDSLEFVLKVPQFGDKIFLTFDVFFQ